MPQTCSTRIVQDGQKIEPLYPKRVPGQCVAHAHNTAHSRPRWGMAGRARSSRRRRRPSRRRSCPPLAEAEAAEAPVPCPSWTAWTPTTRGCAHSAHVRNPNAAAAAVSGWYPCPCARVYTQHPRSVAQPHSPPRRVHAHTLVALTRTLTSQATVVDSRRAMATTVFTADALGLKSTKRCPTTDNMKTVFAPEANHDVARRVRDACRPLRTGATRLLASCEACLRPAMHCSCSAHLHRRGRLLTGGGGWCGHGGQARGSS